MTQSLRCVEPETVLAGADFSTGAVKLLAFDLAGGALEEVRLPTDLWFGGEKVVEGLCELSQLQLEGQVHAGVRALAARLRDRAPSRLNDWAAIGISATHHTAGRIDRLGLPLRRLICWNDHTLAGYHERGLERLGGQERVRQLIGGPWAIRYTLSHLVKDEEHLDARAWKATYRILPHGPMVAGLLTGNFDVTSVSSAASTGIMDLRSRQWCRAMLDAVADEHYRELAWNQLPRIVDHREPVGPLSEHLALEAGIAPDHRPLVFPTSDDQQAGLVGGGAVDDGQVAIVLGNSAVVNSSSAEPPAGGTLDVMRLNWGPYLWMRCYNNGAGLLHHVFGERPDFDRLEAEALATAAGCDGTAVMPFVHPEPSREVTAPRFRWLPAEPPGAGARFRACLEAIAYLIALGVEEHEQAGQKVTRVTVSGGIARSDLMCRILATVLGRRLERLESFEGPALGAAVTALAALENHRRAESGIDEPFPVADAAAAMVRFREPVDPVGEWTESYRQGLRRFVEQLERVRGE